MNLNKLLVTSFLILMISTYQTDSGIIFSLLMKILLLKGALFMTMPLSIGAFMMGQGMGFFAGNMMGGYMMLRAANRYHNTEKVKWTSGGISSGGYGTGGGHQPHYQHYGWKSNNFHDAFDKGKDIGSALQTFTSHKTKIASAAVAALHKVKGIFVGYKSAKPINKGWSWGKPYGGYSHGSHSTHGYNDHDHGHDYHYTSHTKYKPVKSTYKYNPYSHLKSGGSSYSYKPKGYSSGGYSSSSSSAGAGGGYDHYDTDTEVEKGHLDYSDYYPPSSSSSVQDAASYSDAAQDPSNTYYTSAYDGPAHEYTGILTNNQDLETYLQNAQDKSSENLLPYKDLIKSTLHPSLESPSTISPNPVLEKYLEKRLEEEASKQKSVEQQSEAKQLIQMLRKAYLKQLVDSLKEEATSTEASRGSRSIENADRKNIIQQLLAFKSSNSEVIDRRVDNDSMFSESVMDPVTGKNNEMFTSTEEPTTSASTITSSPTFSSTTTSTSTENPSSTTPESEGEEDEDIGYESDSDNIVSSTENSFNDFDMPAMWVKAENTFSDETKPFFIRVRRNAEDSDAAESIAHHAQMENAASDAEKQVTAFVDDIKKFFTLLTVLDQDQCLQKLVCDVHTNQKDPATITPYEQNILTTFRLMKVLMPASEEEDSSSKYKKAALIGETGQSLELCQETYNSCRYSSSQIISLGSQSEASASDWAEAAAATGSQSQARSDYVTMPKVRRSLRSFYI